jgi:sigma-B regulation protein RsbU (phosphoserine phosphatase)
MLDPLPHPTGRADFLLGMLRNLAAVRDPMEVVNTFAEGVRTAYKPNSVIYLSTNGLPPGHYRVLRFQSDQGIELLPRIDPAKPLLDVPVRCGGLLGEICAHGRSFIGDPRQFSDDTDLAPLLAPFRVVVASPVVTIDWWMNWIILLDEDVRALTVDDLENLILQSNLLGVVISNLQMTRQLANANEQAQREVEQIARIQRALLPEGPPEVPGLRIACSYETAVQAGGDLYDFAPLDEHRWAMIVADASGHGPAAAVVAAMVSTLFRAVPARSLGPCDLLTQINCHLNERQVEASFVTAFAATYEPATRRFVYCRAGHNPPLLMDGPKVRQLDGAGGLPLGILPDAPYEDCELYLSSGQTLLLYTDGVTEAGPSVESQFGIEGLTRALRIPAAAPTQIIEHILAGLGAFQGPARRKDDQTLIAICVA